MVPKAFTDSLLEVLSDSRIIEALSKALSSSIKLVVDEIVNTKIPQLERNIHELKVENSKLRTTIDNLQRNNDTISDDKQRCG